jgi:type I restriction enzyme R subunit
LYLFIVINDLEYKAWQSLNHGQKQDMEDIKQSVIVVKDHLSLLDGLFHKFDSTSYFNGTPLEQLNCLNSSADFALRTKKFEKTFMDLTKRLKSAYDIL